MEVPFEELAQPAEGALSWGRGPRSPGDAIRTRATSDAPESPLPARGLAESRRAVWAYLAPSARMD